MVIEIIKDMIDWVWLVTLAIYQSFVQIITTSPIIGIILLVVMVLLAYFAVNFLMHGSYSAAHAIMVIVILIVILVIAYILWTEFDIGGGVSNWLMDLFGGG